MKDDAVIRQLQTAEDEKQKIRQLEEQVKRLQTEVLEYVRVEAVLIAARKLNQDTVQQAHDLVRTCS